MEQTLTLYCNAGRAIVTQKGDLKGYGKVWYYPDGISNILSLSNVQKKHKDTCDSYLTINYKAAVRDSTTQFRKTNFSSKQ